MEDFLLFFKNAPSWFRASILVGGILVFWFLEGLIPYYRFNYKKWKHGLLNISLTLINAGIGLGLAFALLAITEWTATHQFGVLNWLNLPLGLEVLLGVLILDLVGAYFVHYTEHKVKWMWKFHVIHHSDQNVDVTTGLRHHPGEIIFRISFTLLAAWISGASMGIVVIYQSLSVLFAHLTHANLNIPDSVDRTFSYIFVTPKMHKVHHHYAQPYTDTNYGNIFSIWDRAFGTYAYLKKEKIKYGIDTHMKTEENSDFINLMKIPFQPYRHPGIQSINDIKPNLSEFPDRPAHSKEKENKPILD